jgi:hypothetical protein
MLQRADSSRHGALQRNSVIGVRGSIIVPATTLSSKISDLILNALADARLLCTALEFRKNRRVSSRVFLAMELTIRLGKGFDNGSTHPQLQRPTSA